MSIIRLVKDGTAPLCCAPKYAARRILDEYGVRDHPSFMAKHHEFDEEGIADRTLDMAVAQSSFSNSQILVLLRSALLADSVSFRRALNDLRMAHRHDFPQVINQVDTEQNTLVWYLAIGGLYSSIEDLHRCASCDLNVNARNGRANRTILHRCVNHGSIADIRCVLNLGVDANLCDRYDRTAMHYVALIGTRCQRDVEVVQLLIDYGALPK